MINTYGLVPDGMIIGGTLIPWVSAPGLFIVIMFAWFVFALGYLRGRKA